MNQQWKLWVNRSHAPPQPELMIRLKQTHKRKSRQGDCSGRHWRRWSLLSTSPVITRSVIPMPFPSQCNKRSLMFWTGEFTEEMTYLKCRSSVVNPLRHLPERENKNICKKNSSGWRHKSVKSANFTSHSAVCSKVMQVYNNESITALHYWPFLRRTRWWPWIPLTKGQYCGKCVHMHYAQTLSTSFLITKHKRLS